MSRLSTFRAILPRGHSLSDEIWRARHRGIVLLLSAETAFIFVFALVRGNSLWHSIFEASLVGGTALAALLQLPRRVRELIATLGLLLFSATLVHLSGGTIEAHFAYFATLGVVLLYQHWVPFVLYVAFVFLQHAIVGAIEPGGVYNHPAAIADPWTWALIHALFILAASAALVIGWRRNEVLHERAEASFRDLYEGERALVRVKDQLLQTASHELRTPLTVLLGFTRTMREHWDALTDAEKLEMLSVMDGRASHMSTMVDQFLTITQIEAGAMAIETERLDVGIVLRQLIENEGADIEVSYPPRASVRANREHLLLILSNYVGNAKKYGKPPLRVEATQQDGWTEIAVVDSGPGVTAEFVPHLFEKFTQGARSLAGDGFGLGLSLVKSLAEAQGGIVGYGSDSRGARFFVRFPSGTGSSSKPAASVIDVADAEVRSPATASATRASR